MVTALLYFVAFAVPLYIPKTPGDRQRFLIYRLDMRSENRSFSSWCAIRTLDLGFHWRRS